MEVECRCSEDLVASKWEVIIHTWAVVRNIYLLLPGMRFDIYTPCRSLHLRCEDQTGLLTILMLHRIIPTTWLVMAMITEVVDEVEEALVEAGELGVKEEDALDLDEGIKAGMLVCKMVDGIRLKTPQLKTQRLLSNRLLARTNQQQGSNHILSLDGILRLQMDRYKVLPRLINFTNFFRSHERVPMDLVLSLNCIVR
jgi:hypothetical protein